MRAAETVWHRRALALASMEEIASEAGVSKGTLYNFFRNKEDLFVATVMAPYDEFRETFSPRLDEIQDPLARLRGSIDSLCTVFQSVSDHLNLRHQAWSIIVRDPVARDRMFDSLREIYAEFYRSISSTLEEGIECGQIRPDTDVGVFATCWISLFDGMTYRNSFDPALGGRAPAQATLRQCLEYQLQQVSPVAGFEPVGVSGQGVSEEPAPQSEEGTVR